MVLLCFQIEAKIYIVTGTESLPVFYDRVIKTSLIPLYIGK